MAKERQTIEKIAYFVLLAALILYPLRNIWLGLDVTDGAYSAGNYRFLDRINPMWLFSTYLGNVAGQFFTGLSGGHTLIGLRFYTALVVSLTAAISYLFFTRVVRVHCVLAFVGELLAVSLCWCPTTILYNYLTYFFFNAGAVVLYMGLVRERRPLLFLAGVLLGMNVLVRFPNLAEAALICSLWYYGFLQRKRAKDVAQETAVCLLGYLAGVGGVLWSIAAKYGMGAYMQGITMLMQMPSEASDYGAVSMVLAVLLDYKFSAKWLLHMLQLAVVGCMVSMFFRAGDRTAENGAVERPTRRDVVLRHTGRILFLGSILVLFRWWHAIGVFNVKYYTYESMFQWVAVFLILTIGTGVYMLFSGNFTRNEKLLASMALILIGVTPLGSNNHLYPNMNNMFLVFPFGISLFVRFLRMPQEGAPQDGGEDEAQEEEEEQDNPEKEQEEPKGQRRMSLFPMKAMLAAFLMATAMQSLLFGAVFTFRDGLHGEKRDTKIEKNAILRGVVTNAALAEAVEGLTECVEAEGLSDRSVILYGHIPAVSYFLDMPPALSTSWPDLRSYNYAVMEEDMRNLRASGERPLIILATDGPERRIRGEEMDEKEVAYYMLNEKWEMLYGYMVEQEYEKVYGNKVFTVYR